MAITLGGAGGWDTPQAVPPKKKKTEDSGNDFSNRIFLLPTEAIRLVVQYAPLFQISVVLPAQEREIGVEEKAKTIRFKETIKVKTPDLLLMQTGYTQRGVRPEFALFAMKPSPGTNSLLLKSFLMANIHPGGSVCWGEANVVPENLRHANNNFWRAPFNMDLWVDTPGGAKSHRCGKVTHACSGSWNHACQTIGECEQQHRCRTLGKCVINHLCSDDHVVFDELGNIIENIIENHSSSPPSPKRLCPPEKECECCLGACACYPNCECCTSLYSGNSTCECQVPCNCCNGVCNCRCQCKCCSRRCQCQCQCGIKEKFLKHLTTYDPLKDDFVGKNPLHDGNVWIESTKRVCGVRYVATPEHYDAVFVSDLKETLSLLPEKAWRTWKNQRGPNTGVQRPLVIGFANKTPDGLGWEIVVIDNECGAHRFVLPKEQCRIGEAKPEMFKSKVNVALRVTPPKNNYDDYYEPQEPRR